MTRVLLVAAYASVRAGLEALLAGGPDCRIVGQASGAADLDRLLPDSQADVVLMDAMPGEAARVVEALRGTDAALVLLGEDPQDGAALTPSGLRAWGWLSREAEAAEIISAVRAVGAGLIVLDPAFIPLLSRHTPADPDGPPSPPGADSLTGREREVLQLMAQGLPNKQIAGRLSISLHTAKFHVASVLAKLGATSRTEAVTLGVRRGLILL